MIGPKLKQYRLEHDLTFEEMAAIINRDLPDESAIHFTTLQRIENGDSEPHERTLYKIIKALPELAEDADWPVKKVYGIYRSIRRRTTSRRISERRRRTVGLM